MAPRRRFFPSTKVQTVPGRTVELEMQLRPVAKAAAPAAAAPSTPPGDNDIYGVGWFSPAFATWSFLTWSMEADGRWLLHDEFENLLSRWEGDPGLMELPVPTSTFRCVELRSVANATGFPLTYHTGVIQGASMADVRWEAFWDVPSGDPAVSASAGNSFTTWGNVIQVAQVNTGMEGPETLTATAYAGSAVVGTLILHCAPPAD